MRLLQFHQTYVQIEVTWKDFQTSASSLLSDWITLLGAISNIILVLAGKFGGLCDGLVSKPGKMDVQS